MEITTEPAQYPCKEVAGNVWYEWKVGTETLGHSAPPDAGLRLVEEPFTDTHRLFRVVDSTGGHVVNDRGLPTGVIVIPKDA